MGYGDVPPSSDAFLYDTSSFFSPCTSVSFPSTSSRSTYRDVEVELNPSSTHRSRLHASSERESSCASEFVSWKDSVASEIDEIRVSRRDGLDNISSFPFRGLSGGILPSDEYSRLLSVLRVDTSSFQRVPEMNLRRSIAVDSMRTDARNRKHDTSVFDSSSYPEPVSSLTSQDVTHFDVDRRIDVIDVAEQDPSPRHKRRKVRRSTSSKKMDDRSEAVRKNSPLNKEYEVDEVELAHSLPFNIQALPSIQSIARTVGKVCCGLFLWILLCPITFCFSISFPRLFGI